MHLKMKKTWNEVITSCLKERKVSKDLAKDINASKSFKMRLSYVSKYEKQTLKTMMMMIVRGVFFSGTVGVVGWHYIIPVKVKKVEFSRFSNTICYNLSFYCTIITCFSISRFFEILCYLFLRFFLFFKAFSILRLSPDS